MNEKVIIASILGWAAVLSAASITYAAKPKPRTDIPKLEAQTSADPEAERAARTEKARKALAGTSWTVYTSLQDARRPEEGTEVFSFTERRVTTQTLSAQGYAAGGSNYSVYVEDDGTIVWETMLKDEKGEGEVLLRGDLRGEVMSGVIDSKPAGGQRKIYYFTSQKVTQTQPASSAAAQGAAAATKTKKK